MSDNLRVRTRFAPSPTGFMHIGNLRTALYAYLFAKKENGDFILRIEDTDQKRFVEGAVEFITKTLAAAHITADEGPNIGGEVGPYVQSERRAIYQEYAEKLVESGHAYRCFCERGDNEENGDKSVEGDAENNDAAAKEPAKYNKQPFHCAKCRALTKEEIDANLAAGKPFVIRQKIVDVGPVTFHDLVYGAITIDSSEIEDQVLIKRDGLPTYNFANVVDDHLMKISHVIRGAEYLTSTPKHVLLYQAFGWKTPYFVQLPPVMGKNDDGSVSKLSKRHGSTGFSELVDLGYLPEAITNYVALLGWSPKSTQEVFTPQELIEAFSLDGLSKSPAVFDYTKLDWFNSQYLKAIDDEKFASLAKPFGGEVAENLGEKWSFLAALLKTRLSRFNEIAEKIAFFAKLPGYDKDEFLNKKNKVTFENAAEIISGTIEVLNNVAADDWTPDNINAVLKDYVEQSGKKLGTVMWPLRIALSGQKVTPGGVMELLYLLGKDESLARLGLGLSKLQAAG